jgi:N-acyl-D-amino-acid deacylase
VLSYLRDEAARERIKADIEQGRIEGWDNPGAYSGWDNVAIASVEVDDHADAEGETVASVARHWDTEPVYAVCDLLEATDLGVSVANHFIEEDDVRAILASERVNVITDGLFGGNPHPRVYGAFPRVIGTYVRETGVLSLEEAVRKMTSLPAQSMGLDSKGLIRPGMDADLVVFDPDLVASPATYDEPRQHPTCLDHVLVAGDFVVRDGETTGLTPSAVLRA